jgi:hypothetical protein
MIEILYRRFFDPGSPCGQGAGIRIPYPFSSLELSLFAGADRRSEELLPNLLFEVSKHIKEQRDLSQGNSFLLCRPCLTADSKRERTAVGPGFQLRDGE